MSDEHEKRVRFVAALQRRTVPREITRVGTDFVIWSLCHVVVGLLNRKIASKVEDEPISFDSTRSAE